MPCNRLGGCGAFAFEDKCARESAVSQQKSSLHRSLLVASRGRYWCDSAHIAATGTPFPEKYLVARAGPFCREARPHPPERGPEGRYAIDLEG